ncbi:Na-translocating system protein MpsC family protein [Alkalicoccus luteus]|uniref:Na-translocating system protein MpsC family protein n=1 Tax=Alkalicoccus luteus TaxID=1237094 RepID=UPI0040343D9C
MTQKSKSMEAELGSYFSSLLREHFGRGPTSVYVTIEPPFFTVHIRGFQPPMEKILLKRREYQRILDTREMMLSELRIDICEMLEQTAGVEMKEMYTDWNLRRETGLIFGELRGIRAEDQEWKSPVEVNDRALLRELVRASEMAEKEPGETQIYWLNERTVLCRRKKILVEVEKELIRHGMLRELKQAKRPLEHRMLQEVDLESAVGKPVLDHFVSWDFYTDKGYIVLVMDAQ